MGYRLDYAHFECPTCGHRSTPPEVVNAIPHQMETYEVWHPKDLPDSTAEQARLAQLKQKHKNNNFRIENDIGHDGKPRKVVKVDRCYSKVAFQSHTNLEDSKNIVLACPQCNTELFRVMFSK